MNNKESTYRVNLEELVSIFNPSANNASVDEDMLSSYTVFITGQLPTAEIQFLASILASFKEDRNFSESLLSIDLKKNEVEQTILKKLEISLKILLEKDNITVYSHAQGVDSHSFKEYFANELGLLNETVKKFIVEFNEDSQRKVFFGVLQSLKQILDSLARRERQAMFSEHNIQRVLNSILDIKNTSLLEQKKEIIGYEQEDYIEVEEHTVSSETKLAEITPHLTQIEEEIKSIKKTFTSIINSIEQHQHKTITLIEEEIKKRSTFEEIVLDYISKEEELLKGYLNSPKN